MGYSISKFDEGKLPSLFHAFVNAFSENAVKFKPGYDQFKRRILEKLNINSSASVLIEHDEDGVVGFILHTVDRYEGVVTAYNGGMGIIPAHRGQKLSYQFYSQLLADFRNNNINKVLLEVITTNKPAIQLYESLGFRYKRQLKCFRLTKSLKTPAQKIEIIQSKEIKAEYQDFWSYHPTFLDSSNQLIHNLKNEIVLEAHQDHSLQGYIIFQPALGRISQLVVDQNNRGKGIGGALIQKAREMSDQKELTLMNIPEEEEGSIFALQKLGFKNEVDQYEMELII